MECRKEEQQKKKGENNKSRNGAAESIAFRVYWIEWNGSSRQGRRRKHIVKLSGEKKT